MKTLYPKIVEYANLFEKSMDEIREIENTAAINSITIRFTENILKSTTYLVNAIKESNKKEAKQSLIERELDAALHSLNNLAPEACEIVAGKKLMEVRTLILRSRPFAKREKAKALYKEAVYHYSKGIAIKMNPIAAMSEYKRSVEKCREAELSIELMNTKEWATWMISIIGWIVAIIAFIVGIILK